MAKAIHSMIRVLDEARAVEFYRTALGMNVVERKDYDSFTLLYLRSEDGPFELELTVNKGRSEPYDLGNAYGHLAVAVDDLAAEHKRLVAAGLKPTDLKAMQHDGKPFAQFFFLTDPDGYRIEVPQSEGRFR
jgi:lactoylglutathione lyase